MKNIIPKVLLPIFFILFFTQISYGQLSNFTLTVTATNETCTANGALSFTTSGTTAGATMLFTIYHLPNTTTPIATLSGNTYGGLVAGNYRVVATQSLGGQSGTQQHDVTITNQIVLLTYQLTGINSVACFNNGQIIVNVTSGTAVSYEIFAGPIIKPLQPSNIFTGLSAGVYQIRVFDACGEGVVQTFTLSSLPAALQISSQVASPPLSCTSLSTSHIFSAPFGFAIAYPLNVVVTVNPPTGPPPIIFNQTIPSGNPNSYVFSQSIPLFPNQAYSYSITVTDACGNTYVKNGNIANSNIIPTATPTSVLVNCVTVGIITIQIVNTVILVAAPAAYTNTLPHSYTSEISAGVLQIGNLPPGTYTFNVTDVCGNPHVRTVTIPPSAVGSPGSFLLPGCDELMGSVRIDSPNGSIISISITQAPATYLFPLPHNVSFNIIPGGSFTMNSLPVGSYNFHFLNSCGNQYDVPITVNGYQINTNTFAVTQNCNSFNLELHFSSNNMVANSFWLQKFNPVTNQWGHPGTGFAYTPGTPLTGANALALSNNTIHTNLAYSGTFRIMVAYTIYTNAGNGGFTMPCYRELNQFIFDGAPKILDVYSFSCGNNTFEVLVQATGLGPLVYRITTKDGLPFFIDNGTDPQFMGLGPGIYNFQVEDVCGNILNSLHQVNSSTGFQIIASNFCSGQASSLSVPHFPFLTYEWWEASAPTVILSTTSQLQFPSFNPATDQGTYFVRIVYLINATCINNEILSYVISTSQTNPNAGSDAAIAYCGSQGVIDLFTLLTGPHDLNGSWSAVTPGGTLTNNNWNASSVLSGVYQFKYTVTGFCTTSDEALVNITINPIPQTPTASVTPVVCDSQSLQLFATAIPNATYQWSGPNGFVSNLQNPVINPVSAANNGIYTVRNVENGCQSATTSVQVQVAPLPEFTIEFDCIDNVAALTAMPTQNSFDGTTAVYQWSNTNGYSSFDNPAIITGQASGMYTLTVTNSDGCSNSNTIDVASTLCSIPIGLSPNGDGLNDGFDLSGFNGVKEVKIYNRYGMVVFEQENYVNEWKGQDRKGNELPSATYYYVVHFDNDIAKTGWVYLLRENN
jgi:gliding motility-associated-like protein